MENQEKSNVVTIDGKEYKIEDFNPISSDYNQIDFINSKNEITSFEKKHKSEVSTDILNTIKKYVKKN